MVKDKDFDEPLRDFKLRVARVYAYNLKEPNAELHMETPERHYFTILRYLSPMRKVKVLLDAHVSVYAANKSLGFPRSYAFQFHRWHKADAIVDNNGQVYIKSGKVIEGWKR
jgi:hypothetical protein